MKEIKFNYCIPKEYINDKGEKCYALVKGAQTMGVDNILKIQELVNTDRPKNGQPWMQVFNNGKRVTNDYIDWQSWNGITFSDVDTKLFYNNVKQFDVQKLLNIIHDNIQYKYNYNYYCCYISPGGLSYRILYYWECERTEENFMKCALLTEQYTRDLFYSFGTQGKQIIDYTFGRSKVLDSCSKSSKQGLYVCKNQILFSEFTDDKKFGSCDIDDINIEQLYCLNIKKVLNGDKQINNVKYNNKENVNINDIKYYPHHYRRCIYEALMVLFNKDKDKVNDEWKYIAQMIPTSDGNGSGHDTDFYINEPDKNKWFDRFNGNVNHSLHWLDEFGYKYEDNSEYIYYKQFRKSWKSHIVSVIHDKFIIYHVEQILGKKYNKKIRTHNELYEETKDAHCDDLNKSIFDNVYNVVDNIDVYRTEYYKTRFDREDFKYLLNGYSIAQDSVTYKMYADFYYRDDSNIPIIKYNILEDDILLYGYDTENQKTQWHTLKTNDEFTHWCNNDEFSNKASKEKMRDALKKFVSRRFGYHSIKQYLNSLDTNNIDVEKLETWAIRYFNADDTPLTRQICKKFFIAAVKKMLIEDPTKFVFQHMLFLQGATGCGKTYFLVKMFTIDGKQYFLNDIKPDDSDKDIGPKIAKNWMIQFGESKSLTKADVNSVKEFVDRMNLAMKYQKKYENEQTTIYPRIVICRTSNDNVLFNDININEVDRRNWLIVCKTEANSCGNELKKLINDERDILWATALKLYLDDPNQDLELDTEGIKDLAMLQEEYKMIKNDDIIEIYNEIFEREYLTNNVGHIMDEYHFMKMLERSDNALNEHSVYVADLLDDDVYVQHKKINVIPGTWIKNFVVKKYGVNMWKLFSKEILKQQSEYKNVKYNGKVVKCYQLRET